MARRLLSDGCPRLVLVVSCLVMLGVQQVSRFSVDCYVDLHDARIRAVPDQFCVCVCANSLCKLREDAVYDLLVLDERKSMT
jgi:hypothetical protein